MLSLLLMLDGLAPTATRALPVTTTLQQHAPDVVIAVAQKSKKKKQPEPDYSQYQPNYGQPRPGYGQYPPPPSYSPPPPPPSYSQYVPPPPSYSPPPPRITVQPGGYTYPNSTGYPVARGFEDRNPAIRGNMTGCTVDLGYGRYEPC